MGGMAGYTKLFNSILASTIWREPHHVRIVWITLLAMADKHGVAEGSIPGLCDFARVTREDCEDALSRLMSPDPDSRSQEWEGRRIEAVDGGWAILNHSKYRAKLSADERRDYNRVKQAEWRHKRAVSTVNNVNDISRLSALSAHTEAEAEEEPQADPEEKAKEYAPRASVIAIPQSPVPLTPEGEDPRDVLLRKIQEIKPKIFKAEA